MSLTNMGVAIEGPERGPNGNGIYGGPRNLDFKYITLNFLSYQCEMRTKEGNNTNKITTN